MQTAASNPAPRRRSGGMFLLVILLVAVAFAAGFVPQWMQNRSLRATLEETDLQLRLANLHRRLGVASHEAQRNNFGSAGEAAARFFDGCATLARTGEFDEDPRTRVALLAYASQRDDIMLLLSSGDPSVRPRLVELYLTMQGVIDRRPVEGQLDVN